MGSLISVIVPVYNVEQYLDRCVESIVNQTYKNLEIILVDDGSLDGSGVKCDEWEKKDSRIVVIHKENGGLSDARNAGLKIANGKFIGFVDSDDYINVNMFQILIETIKKENADIAECKSRVFFDNDSDVYCKDNTGYNIESFTTEEALRELILERKLKQTAWNKIYKTSIINTLFEAGKINEDEFWTYQIFGNANRIVLVNEELYYYYQRETSIMHVQYSIKRLDGVCARKKRLNYIKHFHPELYDCACFSYIWTCFFHYQVICRNLDIDQDFKYRKKLHEEFCENYSKKILHNQPVKQRMWLWCFLLLPNYTCKIRNTLRIGL